MDPAHVGTGVSSESDIQIEGTEATWPRAVSVLSTVGVHVCLLSLVTSHLLGDGRLSLGRFFKRSCRFVLRHDPMDVPPKGGDSSTKVAEERGKALKIAYADTSAKADLMLMLSLKCRRAVFLQPCAYVHHQGVLNNCIRAQ